MQTAQLAIQQNALLAKMVTKLIHRYNAISCVKMCHITIVMAIFTHKQIANIAHTECGNAIHLVVLPIILETMAVSQTEMVVGH